MSNPSTVWASLSLPISPAGSIPFVSTDLASIITDVTNFSYTQSGVTLSDTRVYAQLTALGGLRVGYTLNNSPASPIVSNTVTGRFIIPAGASSKVIQCTSCFLFSIVFLTLESLDTTFTRIIPAPIAGQFTVTGNAVATANVTVSYCIINPITGA